MGFLNEFRVKSCHLILEPCTLKPDISVAKFLDRSLRLFYLTAKSKKLYFRESHNICGFFFVFSVSSGSYVEKFFGGWWRAPIT